MSIRITDHIRFSRHDQTVAAGTQSAFAPAGPWTKLSVTAAGMLSIQGMFSIALGGRIVIIQIIAGTVTFKHNDPSATAGQRFFLPSASDLVVTSGIRAFCRDLNVNTGVYAWYEI